MIIKLNSTRETKNIMGLSDEALDLCEKDPYHEYLRVPLKEAIEVEKAGEIVCIPSPIEFNVRRGYLVLLEPNPELFSIGSLGYPSRIAADSEPVRPDMWIKMYKKKDIVLDWIYKVRLLG